MENYTSDTFFNGKLKVKQQKDGYRFSIDAVILAFHVLPQIGDTIVDLGTGCGIIPLILGYRHSQINIRGVEIQKSLADIAQINVFDNKMEDRIRILQKDIKNLTTDDIGKKADWVVTNPPYRKINSGRINPDPEKAAARHEIEVTLADVIEAGNRILKKNGSFLIIYPAQRLTDIIFEMRLRKIEPKYIRMIHSYDYSEAKLVVVKGVNKGASEVKIDSPLIIYDKNGCYSDEVKAMFEYLPCKK